ncbi:MAG: DUF3850 domain-containing protein [Proteobacteria bacterium]|nr:DUF3850 domain-containing protein [Pseudomonadota bacterium]
MPIKLNEIETMHTVHYLKTVQPYFSDVANRIKDFDLREDDRNFAVGDYLALQEFVGGVITDRVVLVTVTYKLDNHPGLAKGCCVLGIEFVDCNF